MRLAEKTEEFLKRHALTLLARFVSHDQRELPPPPAVRNILVIRQHDQLGDMLCVVPLLRLLLQRHGGARITLVAGAVNSAVMRHHPMLHEVLEFPKGRPFRFVPFFRALRRNRYELAVVPSTVSSSATSGLLTLCAGAAVRVGAASVDGKPTDAAFCFNHQVELDWHKEPHRHQTLRNLDILGIPIPESLDLSGTIGFSGEELRAANEEIAGFRARYGTIVGMHPGAGKPVNRWAAKSFASLANRIHSELGSGVLITAGPMDEEVIEDLRPSLRCPHLLLHNRPLRHVAAVISLLDLFIANDTGIMHVAGATPVRLISLFGPTDPLQWAPKGEKNEIIQSKTGKMEGIGAGEVFEVVKRALKRMKHDKWQKGGRVLPNGHLR